jgi:hypothetical protein
MRSKLLVVAALLASAPAFGQMSVAMRSALTGFAQNAYGNGYVRVESVNAATAGARVWRTAVGGAAIVEDAVVVATAVGPVAVKAAAGVTLAEGAALIARGVALNPYVAIAVPIGLALLDEYRARNPAAVPGSLFPSAQFDLDPGIAPVAQQATIFTTVDTVSYQDSSGAGSCEKYRIAVWGSGRHSVYESTGANSGWCRVYDNSDNYYRTAQGVSGRSGTSQSCPISIDVYDSRYTIPPGSPVGPDGKCPTARGNHVAATVAQVAQKLIDRPPAPSTKDSTGVEPTTGSYAGALQEALSKPGASVNATPSSISGPASQTGTPVASTTSGSSSGTSTVTPSASFTYTPTTINVTNSSTTSTSTTSNNVTTTTNTTTTNPEVKTCGLPGQPVCNVKVDESGTDTTVTDPKSKLDDASSDAKRVSSDPKGFFPTFPTLNWSFALPTGCAPIPLAAFAPFITSVDICPHQPMFHDLMSVVWVIGGLFGAIQLFLKDALAS